MANWNRGHNHFPVHVGVQSGLTDPKDVASGSYSDIAITFPEPFYSAPTVVVGFLTASTAGSFGRCVAAVYGNPTATGFNIRIYNGDSTGRKPQVSWIAVGTPK